MAISAAADLTQDISTSNSLPDLAARVRAFHEATTENLRRSVEHAMAAGDLLIEAKALLKHGQWLPWLHDHCAISERTAQLYMRTAKNRETIETMAKSATVADLTLNETAALLMISSDVRKLLDFAKQDPELQPVCRSRRSRANGMAALRAVHQLRPRGGPRGIRAEGCLGPCRLSLAAAIPERCRMARLRRRQVARPVWHFARHDKVRAGWAAFLEEHRNDTLADAHARMDILYEQHESDQAAGICRSQAEWRKKRRSGGARKVVLP